MPGGNMPPDSFTSTESKKKEPPKGKFPKWLTWAAELVLPLVSVAVFHKLPLGLSKNMRSLSSILVGMGSTGGLDYWRQKNNDGKVSWGSLWFNSLMGGFSESAFSAARGIKNRFSSSKAETRGHITHTNEVGEASHIKPETKS